MRTVGKELEQGRKMTKKKIKNGRRNREMNENEEKNLVNMKKRKQWQRTRIENDKLTMTKGRKDRKRRRITLDMRAKREVLVKRLEIKSVIGN